VGPTFDLALASYCLNPSRAEHGIAVLAEELLGEAPDPGAAVSVATCRAARAALAPPPLIEERLRAHEMDRLFRELEMPLSEVLAEMELAGIALDVPALARLSTEFGATLERLMAEIYALAGCEFNISSPPQLRRSSSSASTSPRRGCGAGRPASPTDVDVLTRLATQHPCRRRSSSIGPWPSSSRRTSTRCPCSSTRPRGACTPRFNQTVAATGRLSSSDPNLQNIPIRNRGGAAYPGGLRRGPQGIACSPRTTRRSSSGCWPRSRATAG